MQISSISVLKLFALFQVCLNRSDEVQAMKCLAKAVQADPTNLQIHEK
jgi:general transcription factor 3C polypeptide 3 (transcription factor C subunit 4)